MLTYTRIPLTVGAIQWKPALGINTPPVPQDKLLRSGIVKRCWKIRTPAGWVKLNSQDWILTDVNGNYDTLGDEAFRAQFVEVDAKNQAHGVVTKEQLAFRAAMVISIKQFKDKNLVSVRKHPSGQGVLLYFSDGTKGELDATTALDILKHL